jgi:D-3-phosphoglycerate dehydrogenase
VLKVVKTDGVLEVDAEQLASFEGLDIDFIDGEYLTEDELIEHCSDADGLLVLREPITENVVSHLKRCKAISRFGVGLDSIDLDATARAGITVTNVPDSNTEEVATHALAMLLLLNRKLNSYDSAVRAGQWDALGLGEGIRRPGNTILGVVGMGRIGRLVAQRGRVLGFQVWGYDPFLSDEDCAALGVEPVELDTLITSADAVSLHVPLTEQTRNLIDADQIAGMKPGAILVNVSRGGLIDETALASALSSGKLGGAALDAFSDEPMPTDHPLFSAPNTVFSPHAAHYSEQSYAEVRTKAFADLAAVLRGQQPKYRVN